MIGATMQVRVGFVGGPMHGMTALTDGLNDLKVFFPPQEKRVIAYVRDPMIAEMEYIFDQKVSAAMTKDFDQVFNLFNDKQPASLKIEDAPTVQDFLDDEGTFNTDEPIEED